MKSKGQTAPTSLPPPVGQEQDEMNGKPDATAVHQPKIKMEDKMDEDQLTRLTTGVTLDSGGGTTAVNFKPEKAAVAELRKGIIQITAVENDKQPRSIVILTGLKTLFQKQLPKMPREYIARLVYDSNSKALAIIKRGLKVVGGICYRPFPHRGFAEIVFFATASVDQVKGYGAMLMDHFKNHIRATYPEMMHFLTYADNYAVGYFEKQGFSKEITLDRSVWAGYIKDYEVDYLDKANIFSQQTEAIMTKIREYFSDAAILGESGWTPTMTESPIRIISRSSDQYFMQKTMKDVAFQHPVNAEEVPDYYDFIKEPMDFKTMEEKLQANEYPTIEAFLADAQLVFDNCKRYNAEGSVYVKNANKMEKFLKDRVADRIKREQ
ncbi:histone acetyltransferase GCN5 [Mycena sp. CBHHK59/15]|nr:histone acetyltransferase GCN5 [Mycena sp. CBHHK59/15]